MRASDPMYELGMTLGGHGKEDQHWSPRCARSRITSAPRREVTMQSVCVDRGRQWSKASEHLAQRRDTPGIYMTAAPIRMVRRGGSGGAAEGLPDAVVVGAGPNGLAAAIELWLAPAARCSCASGRRRSAAAPRPPS